MFHGRITKLDRRNALQILVVLKVRVSDVRPSKPAREREGEEVEEERERERASERASERERERDFF